MAPKYEGGLGFKDILGFNIAMLAKQARRLWNNLESPCARVLKAKYYANSNVIDTKPKDGMSYCWRSILRGLELIKKGMIWRVGDGYNLNIWKDPWLPRDFSRRPITPRGASLLTRVSELFDPVVGGWDRDLVQETFWPEDAALILAPPMHEGREDTLAWHFDGSV